MVTKDGYEALRMGIRALRMGIRSLRMGIVGKCRPLPIILDHPSFVQKSWVRIPTLNKGYYH